MIVIIIFSFLFKFDNNCAIRKGIYLFNDGSNWQLTIPKSSKQHYFTFRCIDPSCDFEFTFQYDDCNKSDDFVELCEYDGTGNFSLRFSSCIEDSQNFDIIEFLERGIVKLTGQLERS